MSRVDARAQGPRAEVRNAADAQQVKRAERKDRDREDQRRAFYLEVMATAAGRAVMWDLLGRLGLYRSVMHPQGSMLYYNTGRQDFAHELLGYLIEEVDEQLYLAMEAEARKRARLEAQETDAAHTRRAEESEDRNDG